MIRIISKDVKPVPAPGTGPNATSSIYDDVAEGLNKVGHAAYAAIPEPIKDALSTHQTHVAGSTTGTSTTGVHGGAAGLLDQAKIQVQNVVAQVEEKLGSTRELILNSWGCSSLKLVPCTGCHCSQERETWCFLARGMGPVE